MTAQRKRVLVSVQYLLLVAGISALGYCAIASIEAMHYQIRAREQTRKGSSELAEPSTTRSSETRSQPMPLLVSNGMALVGKLDVPRIHVSVMVAEGTSPRVLRVAAGHIPGTALPGQAGNVALAAHRDTFFRRLGDLKTGDVIRLTVPGKQYVYSVKFTDIVGPKETWVLDPSTGESLTLVTCYPFYFVGPAPKRFVVRARRMDSD
jgi:sortase A